MQDVIREMSEAVQSHGGTIEKLTGDGLMALFGAPLAVEDAPVSACASALDILERIAELGNSLMESEGVRPHVRVGINTGYAVVGSLGAGLQQEVTALGDSVNLAARLEGLADSDGIVIGETTYGLIADFMETEFAGEKEVKGKAGKQKIWHLRGAKGSVRRFDASLRRGLTKLVGRDGELDALLSAFSTCQEGKTQVANLKGDAGIGKSRLVHEFRQRLPAEGVAWLQGNCTANGTQHSFLPFIDVVRSSFGMSDDDPAALVERRLRRGLEVLGEDPDATVPYLLNLLGHKVEGSDFTKEHAEVAGIRTRDILHRLLVERCKAASVVLHIDDLHWIDQASQSLLERLIKEELALPLIMLFTHRPEYHPPWSDADKRRTITLLPLTTGATEEMLRTRLGVQELPKALSQLVLKKAEGNPLFAEEILNYLEDRGGLANGTNVDMLDLPVSLENLLMARVDRLDQNSKSLLQAASVIGRVFSGDVAGEVAELGTGTPESMTELQRVGLVQIDEQSGDYQFKHALLQDAVYGSLLTERREGLHERTAQALEIRHASSIGEITETLAHHYGQTPRAEKAVHYMAEAGAKSLRVYSLPEADLRLRQVVALIETVPDCADDTFLTDVLLQLARVNYFRADMNGIQALLKPHLARVEALEDPKRLADFLFELGYSLVFGEDPKAGMALFERSRSIATEIGDELVIGRVAMGEIWYQMAFVDPLPETRARINVLEEIALAAGRKARDIWLISKTYTAMSLYGGIIGNPKSARDYSRRLFDLSRETNDPRARNMGLWTMASSDMLSWAYEEAIENGREAYRSALSEVDGYIAHAALAGALGLSGHTDEAVPMFQSAHDTLLERGMIIPILMLGYVMGPILVIGGDIARGMAWQEEGLARCEKFSSAVGVAYTEMVIGETYTQFVVAEEKPPMAVILKNFWFLLRTLPRAKSLARKHLNRALTYFRHIDAPGSIAMVLFDLALIDLKQNRKETARQQLDEALTLAQSVEADALADKISAALGKI